MKIPKYWAKGEYSFPNSTYKFIAWKWSDTSLAEAQQLADQKAREIASIFQRRQRPDRYTYGRNPLREEIIQSITNPGGNEIGVITRNGYGALVLNAAKAMFIDIDFPDAKPGEALARGIGRLFGGQATLSPEQTYLQAIEKWAQVNRGLSLRVYRTFGGLRCLVTNELFDPAQPTSLALMQSLQSDRLYITLCKQQECFRARLTPKPWRINFHQPPTRFPWSTPSQEAVYRNWEQEYERASSHFTTCRLLKEIGAAQVHPDIAPILATHDRIACTNDALNLA
jgi:hypothetical protein